MATIFRITFGFAGPQGWTENHAMDNNSANPADLVPTLTNIAQLRAKLLGREFYINAIRISTYRNEGGPRARGVLLVKQLFQNPNQTVAWAAEPAEVAYQVLGQATPPQPPLVLASNNNDHFLGGPIDNTVTNAGFVDTSQNNLLANFQSWSAAMVNANLGWLSYPLLLDSPISTITQNTDGTVSFLPSIAPAVPFTVGQRYPARVRGINGGTSVLNGEVIVVGQADSTLKTAQPIAFKLQQLGGAIKVYDPLANFIDYASLTLGSFTIKHKRGKPFLSPRGRAKKRIRA